MLGQVHYVRWLLGWNRDAAERDRSFELNRRALELDPEQAHAHATIAQYHLLAGRLPEAEASARRALAIDPSRPGAYFTLAIVHAQQGRPLDAAAEIRRYLRVNPRANPAQSGGIAWINYLSGQTEEAQEAELQHSLRQAGMP